MEKELISKNQLINQLIRVGHGNFDVYRDTITPAVKEEPELFAHLIAWNHIKGEVRDSKVAFPILALRGTPDLELYENAVAHLLLLDPRNLLRAVEYHSSLNHIESYQVRGGAGNLLEMGIRKYIKIREATPPWWIRTALQHRKSLKSLYARYHVRPNELAEDVLFKRQYHKGSVFEALTKLKDMPAIEAAGTILNFKIPFLIAIGALGGIKGKPDLLMALIERMSGNELINHTEMLRKAGVFDSPVLKAAFDNAISRAKKDKRVSTLKAGKAAEKIGDKKVAAKMASLQEDKLAQLGGIDGDWLILGDRSGSMDRSIDMARFTAALIAQQVKGQVHLIFFNVHPMKYNVTGKTLEEIKEMTKRINATGGTSIGCGVELLREQNILVNGIVICSDGGDNTRPLFADAYRKYSTQMGIDPTVYHFWMPGEDDQLSHYCRQQNITVQKYDLSKDTDYYSLPNIIKTLRASNFALLDEIMQTPLLTINVALAKRG